MSLVLVTGATGFIGGHVVQALLSRGYQVRAFLRPGWALEERQSAMGSGGVVNGPQSDLEVSYGDVTDPPAVAAAVQGCDGVVHTAGLYTFWTPRRRRMRDVNVNGTRNVLQAAADAGVGRIVYTSTVGTVRLDRDGALGDETEDALPHELTGPYKRSKFEAERVARQLAHQGAPVVIVNPTAPVGPGDNRPTPTGRVILDFLRRGFPAYVDTGLNFVSVTDVAEGHVLALERGRVGERYLLGNLEGNLSLKELFGILERITGVPAPKRQVPWALAMAAAYLDWFVEGTILRRQPRIPLEGTRMARKRMWVDCSKSVRELGLPQRPVEEALREAVAWFAAQARAAKTVGA